MAIHGMEFKSLLLASALATVSLSAEARARFSDEVADVMDTSSGARSSLKDGVQSSELPVANAEELARQTGLSPVLCESLMSMSRKTAEMRKDNKILPDFITEVRFVPDIGIRNKSNLKAIGNDLSEIDNYSKTIPALSVDNLGTYKQFIQDLASSVSTGWRKKWNNLPYTPEENTKYVSEMQNFISRFEGKPEELITAGKKEQLAAAFERFNKHATTLPGGSNWRTLFLLLSDSLDVEAATRMKEVVRKAKAIDYIDQVSRYALLTTPTINGGAKFTMTNFDETTGQAIPLVYTYISKTELAKSDLPENLQDIGEETMKRLSTKHETMLSISEGKRLDTESAQLDVRAESARAESARLQKLTKIKTELHLLIQELPVLVGKFIEGDASVKTKIDQLIDGYRNWMLSYKSKNPEEQAQDDEQVTKAIISTNTLIAQYKTIEQSKKSTMAKK